MPAPTKDDVGLEQRRGVFAPERHRSDLPREAVVAFVPKLVPDPDLPYRHGQPAERARTGRGGRCAGPSLEPERSSRRPSASRSPDATSAPSRIASASPIGSSPRRKASRSSGLHVNEPEPHELLWAIANLSTPPAGVGPQYSRRMVGLLIDGLRYGAGQGAPASRASRRSRG